LLLEPPRVYIACWTVAELKPCCRIEFEQEDDGRWIAEIPVLPGVMAYGTTQQEARGKVEALALRTLADRLEHGEPVPELGELFVAAA
jgi:predicted RNase H-like HicB family nuclease